jgi:hypothetical protein
MVLVDNYNLTNTTFYASEFQMQGSIGFGRPNLTDPFSSSYLSQAYRLGLIPNASWSYCPPAWPNYTNPGTIMVGGYNEMQAVNNTFWWIPTPVIPTDPDAWTSPIDDVQISLYDTFNATDPKNVRSLKSSNLTAYFSTGYQFIGLPTSIWQHLCEDLAHYLDTTVVCNSTSNADRLIQAANCS